MSKLVGQKNGIISVIDVCYSPATFSLFSFYFYFFLFFYLYIYFFYLFPYYYNVHVRNKLIHSFEPITTELINFNVPLSLCRTVHRILPG